MASAAAARSASQEGAAAKATERVQVAPPSRREFLYYIWGASVILLLGEVGAGVVWLAYPRFAEGTFGGTFNFDPENIPAAGSGPYSVPEGRFHVANLDDESLVVLYGVCTHLGCLPAWVGTNHRFECPCHGSKYELSGLYIEGPAPRSLDRFRTEIEFDDGTIAQTNDTGDPIPLEGRRVAAVRINTGDRILRSGRV